MQKYKNDKLEEYLIGNNLSIMNNLSDEEYNELLRYVQKINNEIINFSLETK